MASKKVLIEIGVIDKNVSPSLSKAKKGVDELATSTNKLAKANKGNRAQSGLNNAILIESGRVASDAAYGIQGMANNIGRIIELGQEFARTNKGGMGAALQDLKKSLFGVGGVLIGVQLLLSFLPKIVKKFKEVSDGTSDLSVAVRNLRKDFLDLKEEIKESNEALVDQDDTIKTLLGRLKLAVKANLSFRLFGNTDFIDKTLERLKALGVEIDKNKLLSFEHDPEGLNKFIDQLLSSSGKIDKVTQEVVDLGTDLAVQRILGKKTPVELAEMALQVFIKEQEALGVKEEEYVKSREYQILLAKIEAAKIAAREAAKKNAPEKDYEELPVRSLRREIEAIKELGKIRSAFHKKNMGLLVQEQEFAAGAIEMERQQRIAEIDATTDDEIKKRAALREVNAYYDGLMIREKREALLDLGQAIVEASGQQSAVGKATAIAMALFNTYEGITAALKIAPPLGEIYAATRGLMGFAQVRNIMKIDPNNPKVPSSGGGASGRAGGGLQAPEFNLVGASATNQLAMAVGESGLGQPIRAYVVGKDITNQQEFDNNQTNIAGTGGGRRTGN